jgi:hypothetical protein
MSQTVSSRVASLKKEVEVRAVSVAGQEVLLCARRHRRHGEPGEALQRDLDQAADGISRILTRAA